MLTITSKISENFTHYLFLYHSRMWIAMSMEKMDPLSFNCYGMALELLKYGYVIQPTMIVCVDYVATLMLIHGMIFSQLMALRYVNVSLMCWECPFLCLGFVFHSIDYSLYKASTCLLKLGWATYISGPSVCFCMQ